MSEECLVNNFLFWNLDTGVYIIAFMQMVTHMMTWLCFMAITAFIYNQDMQRLSHETDIPEEQLKHLRTVLPLLAVFETIDLIMCTTLIFGLYQQDPQKIASWLAYTEIVTLLRFVLSVLKSVVIIVVGQFTIGISCFIKATLYLAVQVYILVVVYCYYMKMEK